MSDDDAPIISREPDDLHLSIQAQDDAYFAEHPADDYYIRDAIPNELALMGHADYSGLMLVYVVGEGARLRMPVASVDEALQFVVDFEKNSE